MRSAKRSSSDGQSKRKKKWMPNPAATELDSKQEKQEELKELEEWDKRIRSEDWIVKGPEKTSKWKCRVCPSPKNKEYSSRSWKSHLESDRHKQNASSKISRDAELKFAAFIAESNISLHHAEKLAQSMKDRFPDSEICQALPVNGEDVKSIITNSLGPDIKSELANKLRTRKFSILADKLTDISSAKTFSIMVRYFDDDNGRMKIGLWKLFSIKDRNDREAMKEHLYKAIKESFNEFNIPIQNIVGFGSHGCDVIMSAGENSVASGFEKDCCGILITKCISHSIHLCASEAAESLPCWCEELARIVISSLKCETDKSSLSVDLQPVLELEPHGMLHPYQARWLSDSAVGNCMLEHWQKLDRFYDGMQEPGKLIFRDSVLGWLRDEYNELYYHFVQSVLQKLDDFNALFESPDEVVTELHTKAKDIYIYILECFLQKTYLKVTRLQDIDPLAEDKQLPHSQLDLGVVVLKKIIEITKKGGDSRDLDEFISKCLKFLKRLATEMKKCFPFGNSVMEQIEVLSPKYIRIEPVKTLSILELAAALPLSISSSCPQKWQALNDQWRESRRKIKNFPEEITKENRPHVFWGKILILANAADDKELSAFARFALDSLVCIPNTNADYARMFKEINRRWTGRSDKTVSDFEATCRVAFSWGDMERDGTGCIAHEQSAETINDAVDSSTVQVEPEPIASTSQT